RIAAGLAHGLGDDARISTALFLEERGELLLRGRVRRLHEKRHDVLRGQVRLLEGSQELAIEARFLRDTGELIRGPAVEGVRRLGASAPALRPGEAITLGRRPDLLPNELEVLRKHRVEEQHREAAVVELTGDLPELLLLEIGERGHRLWTDDLGTVL